MKCRSPLGTLPGSDLGVVDRSGTSSPGVNVTRDFGMIKGRLQTRCADRATLISATY